MAAAPTLTPARRATAAALLFLGAAALAGLNPGGAAVDYRVFGLTEGLLALLLCYILLVRDIWIRPAGALGWLAIGYGTLANAQLWELLLPPPGVIEWVIVVVLALGAWGALAGGSRQRLLASLAGLALLLALLKFSVVPMLWERVGPAPGEGFGLGNVAEGFRRFFVAEPPATGGQLLGFAALCCWVLATYLLRPAAEGTEGGETLRARIQRVLEE